MGRTGGPNLPSRTITEEGVPISIPICALIIKGLQDQAFTGGGVLLLVVLSLLKRLWQELTVKSTQELGGFWVCLESCQQQ